MSESTDFASFAAQHGYDVTAADDGDYDEYLARGASLRVLFEAERVAR